jgi:redox-sensitive bicupin YhaK (pirin superfamily)
MPHPPREGTRMGGFQLWVNMPAALKMSEPRYQDVPSASIPTVTRDDGTTIRVIAGEVDGVSGPVREIYADPTYLDVTVPAARVSSFDVPGDHTVFAYVFEGEGLFGATDVTPGEQVGSPRLVLFGDGESVSVVSGSEPVRFPLVEGKPLGEPVARYGPFVMNTRAELDQALRDLHDGTFVYGSTGRQQAAAIRRGLLLASPHDFPARIPSSSPGPSRHRARRYRPHPADRAFRDGRLRPRQRAVRRHALVRLRAER